MYGATHVVAMMAFLVFYRLFTHKINLLIYDNIHSYEMSVFILRNP